MQRIEITMPGGTTAEAFVARPTTSQPDVPGVLFFMDAIGLRPQIADMMQRIADWGYVVLAPNAFYRWASVAEVAPARDLREPGAREEFFPKVMPHVMALTGELAESDIPVYLSALRGLDGVLDAPTGTTGYCMGARLAIRAAGLDPQVTAVGGFHGGHLVTPEADSPHAGLAAARAEFVFGHADNDDSMTPDNVDALGEALSAAGLTATNVIYPDAMHGYTMADTSMYDEASAERHFTELQALFARNLTTSRGATHGS